MHCSTITGFQLAKAFRWAVLLALACPLHCMLVWYPYTGGVCRSVFLGACGLICTVLLACAVSTPNCQAYTALRLAACRSHMTLNPVQILMKLMLYSACL